MCKALIYTANTAGTAVVAGGTVPLGTTIRRFGRGAALSGNGIALTEPGYYAMDASITLQPTAAGAITVTLYKDGVAIPGAVATATAAAAGNTVNLSIDAVVLQQCCAGMGVLTLGVSAAATLLNAAVVLKKE